MEKFFIWKFDCNINYKSDLKATQMNSYEN